MKQNFEITAGDTVPVIVTISDDSGAAVNLTGASARWAAAPGTPRRFGSPVITKDPGAGIAITNAAAGELTVTLEPADTEALSGDYFHELQVTDSSGSITTPLSGLMTVNRPLVRPA